VQAVKLAKEEPADAIAAIKEGFPRVLERFESAIKMRPWISLKKNEIAEKREEELKRKALAAKKVNWEKDKPRREELETRRAAAEEADGREFESVDGSWYGVKISYRRPIPEKKESSKQDEPDKEAAKSSENEADDSKTKEKKAEAEKPVELEEIKVLELSQIETSDKKAQPKEAAAEKENNGEKSEAPKKNDKEEAAEAWTKLDE
jgi:hypothetical protein